MLERACRGIDRVLATQSPKALCLGVHPRSLSRLQGDRKSNLERLAQLYPEKNFSVATDASLSPDDVSVRPA